MTVAVDRQAKWHMKQRARGLCRSCNEPVSRGGLCVRHYAMHRTNQKRRYHERKIQDAWELIETIRLVDGHHG